MSFRLILASLAAASAASKDELLSVNIVIRHGDRAPSFGWATDDSEDVFFRGHDELSDSGIDHVYEQGSHFRIAYFDNEIVDRRFLPHEVYVRSSAVNRCLMSAASFTRSLFYNTSKKNPVIPPIYSNDKDNDYMLQPHLDCQDGWEDVKSKFNLTDPDDVPLQAAAALLKTDWDCQYVPGKLFDAIVAELPNELIHMRTAYKDCAKVKGKKFMYKYIELLAGAGSNFNELRIKRNAGLLTNELLKNFAEADKCTTAPCSEVPKMRIYYTHDVTELAIAHIFGVLPVFNYTTPAFSSALVFETYRNTTNQGSYVQILLKNGEKPLFEPTNNCYKKDCSVAAVTKAAKPFAITESIPCKKVQPN
ncbi:hypothetical protein PENTCL1PPCAC_4306 [Pristionchus entomophagus]|uniref:acid phosphatase n=1 Tax=Pristionchus entomophagus TaxID=358040 RepID=A0AAV5SRG9_9BILA|nr:hypothetical protein PENTCL1PPCAC_4306 [Pristionchus entomophagus]